VAASRFNDEVEGARAYDVAALLLFGEEGPVNFTLEEARQLAPSFDNHPKMAALAALAQRGDDKRPPCAAPAAAPLPPPHPAPSTTRPAAAAAGVGAAASPQGKRLRKTPASFRDTCSHASPAPSTAPRTPLASPGPPPALAPQCAQAAWDGTGVALAASGGAAGAGAAGKDSSAAGPW
jgi:hypothetical protein